MVTVVVFAIPLVVAEIVVVPGVPSAVKVAVAMPEAFVVAEGEMLPKSAVKDTGWFGIG